MAPESGSANRSTLRAIVLVVLAVVVLAASLATLRTIWSPAGVFGWNIAPDGVTVITVTPGYPAQRAGIVPGDRIVYATLPLRGRFNTIFVTPLRPGEALSFDLEHAGMVRHETLVAVAWPAVLTRGSSLAGLTANVVSIVAGIVLVMLRPNLMTWAFLLNGALAVVPFSDDPYNAQSDAAMAAVLAANNVLNGVAVAGAFVFIGRFPTCESRPWTTWLDRLAIPWVLAVTACTANVMAALLTSSAPPLRWVLFANQYGLPAAGTIIMLAALVANFASSRGSIRIRIFPVMLVFALGAAFSLVAVIVNDLLTDPAAVFGAALASQIAGIAFPLTVVWAVFRHRVMDINFVISRTLVYTLLTAGIVAVFALVHYLVGKLLERTGIEIALELALAVAYGVWLQVLHDRLDLWIDRVLFRRRHLAETRLERIADALPLAETPAFVDQVLTVEVADALGLASTAVFRRDDDGPFVRRVAVGWSDGDATSLDGNDRLVVELRSLLRPLDLTSTSWIRKDLPAGVHQPLYAVPLCVEHRVTAIALFSGHTGGEALDPDEKRLLRRVASSAGTAYDHLESLQLVRKINELESENAGLRSAQSALSEATQALRSEIAALSRLLARSEPTGQSS